MNIHDPFRHLSDDELLQKTAEARDNAHRAPKNLFQRADGGTSLGNSSAWARWSAEWMRLANEVDRRGLRAHIT